MTELQLQIRDTRRWLDAIEAADAAGKVPELSDARLLARYAAHVERMVELANIAAIRAAVPRTTEEDKASQVYTVVCKVPEGA